MQESIKQIVTFYEEFDEKDRLSEGIGQVEFLRTQEIIRDHTPEPPAVILDVGGATGAYAFWLAKKGYEVHLVDPVPRHIEQAKEIAMQTTDCKIASFEVGDARQLDVEDCSADVVLLLGPLYHLCESEDRHLALREAYRVLLPGGKIIAAIISKFASMIDGLHSGYCRDPSFRKIIRRDLIDGQHRNPTDNPLYFMDIYFQHPDELITEVEASGFVFQKALAVEGMSYLMKDLQGNLEHDESRQFLLEILRTAAEEPAILGASPHIIGIAEKQ